MRFRQLINPTYKNLYEMCLIKAPFYQNEIIQKSEPDHSYSRPWIDDPTLATAIPRVQLFFHSNFIEDVSINIEEETTIEKINWGPTINTILPETFQYEENFDEILTVEQEKFIRQIRELLDETHLASLCCELNSSDVTYWRLSIHHIVSKLSSFLKHYSEEILENLLIYLHEYLCKTLDRISLGHYVDLFQILYHEYPKFRSLFVKTNQTWSTTSLCFYVYNKLLQKPNDLIEEVIYSINLSPVSIPIICLIIPGYAYGGHMQRMEFWQRNLSQIGTVMISSSIEKEQIQTAYEDIISKYNEIRQLYRNHHIMFLAWNVGCILALKAALVCSISSVICMSLPFNALSEETKNEFTQINASILFLTGDKQLTNQIDSYRQRLKSRNGLIELGECNEKLLMSENGKYRFRLPQQLVDKLIMEEIFDFITILSPKTTRDEIDEELKKKKFDRPHTSIVTHIDDYDEPFLNTGKSTNTNTITTLTIPPEQDPNSIFLNTILPSSTTTRKRKSSNLVDKEPTGTKRGRQRTKNLDWAPPMPKPPTKTTTKKTKQTVPPPLPPSSTATTSILNTLLQLPSHQPKPRPTDSSNLLKPIHQPPSFVHTILSSNPFFQ